MIDDYALPHKPGMISPYPSQAALDRAATQRRVIALLVSGMPRHVVAQVCGVSLKTVNRWLSRHDVRAMATTEKGK